MPLSRAVTSPSSIYGISIFNQTAARLLNCKLREMAGKDVFFLVQASGKVCGLEAF